ncbi:Bric-a-brac protein [Quillaja saponaria]|uniref:Bric-a-brac protein n=1 Tax=Quillaja saponaria TaxID=32244 RepID=A0AAD7LMH8_QUISA|nr:Bric-a-brac protein [Quillaja saponaria]
MAMCFPSTPKKLAMTVACFISGAALFGVGVHLSYINIAPQQARTKARNDFVKERLRKNCLLGQNLLYKYNNLLIGSKDFGGVK